MAENIDSVSHRTAKSVNSPGFREARGRGRLGICIGAFGKAGERLMTDALTAQQCLERARMHEQLAATTADASARMMHQAMAAEFRRRAELGSIEIMPRPVNRPMGEMARLTG